MQLIIMVEANKKSKSDYMYVRSVINNYYKMRLFAIKPVYAGGKGNFENKKKEIEKLKKDYDGESFVLVVADIDPANNPANSLNDGIKQFCLENKYELAWMNLTIEDVFLKKIVDDDKSDVATKYYSNVKKADIEIINLRVVDPTKIKQSSNLLIVLDKLLKNYTLD